jgi:hypothetical protein
VNYRPNITSYIKERLNLMIIGLQFILLICMRLFFVVSKASSLSRGQRHIIIIVRELNSSLFGAS